MKRILLIGTYLILLCCVSGNFLFVTDETNSYIILIDAIFFSLILSHVIKFNLKKLIYSSLSLSFILLVFALVHFPLKLELFFILAVYLFLIKLVIKDECLYEKKLISVFLVTLFFYLIFWLICLFIPAVWLSFQAYAQFISKNIAWLIGKKALFGATTLGVTTTILFIIFVIVCYFSLKNKSATRLIFTLISLFIAQLLSVPIQISVVGLIKRINHSIYVSPMDVIFIPLLLGLIPVFFFIYKRDLKDSSGGYGSVKFKYFFAGLVLLFISIILLTFYEIHQKIKSTKTVYLYSKGIVNWNKPEFGRYGLRSSGMFGMLPEYLNSFSYKVVVDSVFDQEALKDVNTFVAININKNFSEREKNDIINFVKNGGSLLVLGDHTGLGGMLEPLNDLVKFAGIEYNFDSAHYLKMDWGHSLEFLPHPITYNLKNNIQVGISVGASLRIIKNKAMPIIVAKFGFSDWGNALNKKNAYLGDRRYNEGELLGDIILVAYANYGKGKVLVFGDTSSFQNGVLERNFIFINRIFNWLAIQDNFSFRIGIKVLGIIFLIFGLFSLIISNSMRGDDSKIILLFVPTFLAMLCSTFLLAKPLKIDPPRGRIAYIDWAHLERFDIYGDEGQWSLSYNLMRNGYLPFVHRKFSENALDKAQLFISIAPAKSFSTKELNIIDNYIKKGGVVIWTVGHEEKEASSRLLNKYGLDIDNVPLGPVPKTETDKGIKFVEAWPIIFQDKNDTQVLCTAWDFPAIVAKEIGNGKLILIADSYFLLSQNLEQDYSYYEENINFLKSLLENL